MRIRAMLSRMDVWPMALLSTALLLVSKGYRWGIGWIDFLERLESFRAHRRPRVGPVIAPALEVGAESREAQCVPDAQH
jgi:hypothetical protein